jgi:rhamnosyltransferase subunit B
MGRVVLATMGSWGDIFPVIGLAKGLTEAGHDVRVAASAAYDELVQGEGLQFSGIGPAWGFADYASEPRILSGRLGGFVGFSHLFRRFIFPALDRYVDDLAASIRGVDLLLAHPALIAAPVAAEHGGSGGARSACSPVSSRPCIRRRDRRGWRSGRVGLGRRCTERPGGRRGSTWRACSIRRSTGPGGG